MALNVKEELKRMDADLDRQRADLLAEAPEGVNIETIYANWTKMRQALEAGDRIQYEPLKSFFETHQTATSKKTSSAKKRTQQQDTPVATLTATPQSFSDKRINGSSESTSQDTTKIKDEDDNVLDDEENTV
ncbi:hypothetical protein B5807_11984 [Epicoccum nigrum]|uniref:Uncharacterized protein n=1 Tax=Epicoccum nigrum TaxID=105696 RepID=A0A1Y2LIN8_EPING|nr:hypothetical protein B5807_11984 [Epicoccum nigrum]